MIKLLLLSFSARIEKLLGFLLLPFFLKRYSFEKKHSMKSFNDENLRADYCFEFSSEGEFARIKPLALQYLCEGKKIELIFSSGSVKKEVQQLEKKYVGQIRYLAYPYFNFHVDLRSWISAKNIGLVRYDFFPKLLEAGLQKERLNLYSGVFKTNYLLNTFVYPLFDEIYAASSSDAEKFSEYLGKEVIFKEFRAEGIRERQFYARSTVEKSLPYGGKFLDYLSGKRDEVVVAGSFWFKELETDALRKFLKLPRFKQFFIFAHDLSDFERYSDKLKDIGSLLVVDTNSTIDNIEEYRFIVINVRGILCEMYSFFDYAYVGGGFLKSIHSVLEPGIAGCKIWVGPKVHRSAEYRVIKESDSEQISVLT